MSRYVLSVLSKIVFVVCRRWMWIQCLFPFGTIVVHGICCTSSVDVNSMSVFIDPVEYGICCTS